MGLLNGRKMRRSGGRVPVWTNFRSASAIHVILATCNELLVLLRASFLNQGIYGLGFRYAVRFGVKIGSPLFFRFLLHQGFREHLGVRVLSNPGDLPANLRLGHTARDFESTLLDFAGDEHWMITSNASQLIAKVTIESFEPFR